MRVRRQRRRHPPHRQGFVPTISQDRIAEAFDNRVRQIEDRDGANVTAEALRPLAGLSLASVVVRTAGRVAAANQNIHPGELQALKLIRLMMMTFPVKKACDSPRTSISALSHVKRPRLRGRKPSEPRLPRYYFTIRSPDHENIDPQGTELADDDAALDYACRMIRWLQASGGYDDPGLMLQSAPKSPPRSGSAHSVRQPHAARHRSQPLQSLGHASRWNRASASLAPPTANQSR